MANAVRWIMDNYGKAYQMFLDWYKSYFLSRVKERGDFIEYFKQKIIEWEEEAKKHFLGDSGELAMVVDNYCRQHGINEINLLNLSEELANKKLIRRNLKEDSKRNFWHIPFFRCSSLYETVCSLRYKYGWRNSLLPGVLNK